MIIMSLIIQPLPPKIFLNEWIKYTPGFLKPKEVHSAFTPALFGLDRLTFQFSPNWNERCEKVASDHGPDRKEMVSVWIKLVIDSSDFHTNSFETAFDNRSRNRSRSLPGFFRARGAQVCMVASSLHLWWFNVWRATLFIWLIWSSVEYWAWSGWCWSECYYIKVAIQLKIWTSLFIFSIQTCWRLSTIQSMSITGRRSSFRWWRQDVRMSYKSL